jgi:hypothetical protein
MIGKYQIVEEVPGESYAVYYKDFGEQYHASNLTDAIIFAVRELDPPDLHHYRAA